MREPNNANESRTNWSLIAVSAAVTVLVTVVSGVAVYYITRQEPPPPAAEKIVYSVERSATFDNGNGSLTFFTIAVENVGKKAARHVRIIVPLKSAWKLRDRRVSISSGAAAEYQDKSDPGQIAILLEHLVPNERVKISALLDGPAQPQPSLSVQSDDTVGTPAQVFSAPPASDEKGYRTAELVLLVAAALIGQLLLLQLSKHWRRRKQGQFDWATGKNNTAFVFLLQGLASEAQALLTQELLDDGGEAISFANHGLAVGLLGNEALAAKRFEAADWLAQSPHSQAIVAFDWATLLIHKGDYVEARKLLRKAFSLERREIAKYCSFSIYIRHAVASDKGIAETVATEGRNGVEEGKNVVRVN